MSLTLTWLGHASFVLAGARRVYIDPWKIDGGDPADVVVVTHSHYDHLSAEDVAKIAGDHTVILAPPDAASQLAGDVRVMAPGERFALDDIAVQGVAAYNIGKKFHPKDKRWLGAIVEMDTLRVYNAGDTDVIPEMQQLGAIDVALLPVGGTYTMDATEAAQAARQINPRHAIPYHWGDIVGSDADAQAFADACDCPVTILKPGESVVLAE